MTTQYTVSIRCDICGEGVEAAPVKKTAGVASTLVKELKREGWSRCTKSMLTDLCPKCIANSRKGELK